MKLAALRKELKAFYAEQLPRITADYSARCCRELDRRVPDDASACLQKARQYEIIAEICETVLFQNCRFFFELAAVEGWSDGLGEESPGEWLYQKRKHLFWEWNPALYQRRT